MRFVVFSVEQLRGFVAVAQHLHFGRAAQQLHMTQPPLSRQIQKLEAALKVQLFVRGNRHVKLTSAGDIFLLQARRILALIDETPRIISDVAQGVTGSLQIGFTSGAVPAYVGGLVTAFHRKYPEVHVQLSERVSGVQLEQLMNRELDVAFTRQVPLDAGLRSRLVHTEPLVVALPETIAADLGEGPVGVEQLSEFSLIHYSPHESGYFHDKVNKIFSQAPPQVEFEMSQINSVLSMVAAGSSIGIVSQSSSSLNIPNVSYRPFRPELLNSEVFHAELYAVWREDSINPALTSLFKVIENYGA